MKTRHAASLVILFLLIFAAVPAYAGPIATDQGSGAPGPMAVPNLRSSTWTGPKASPSNSGAYQYYTYDGYNYQPGTPARPSGTPVENTQYFGRSAYASGETGAYRAACRFCNNLPQGSNAQVSPYVNETGATQGYRVTWETIEADW